MKHRCGSSWVTQLWCDVMYKQCFSTKKKYLPLRLPCAWFHWNTKKKTWSCTNAENSTQSSFPSPLHLAITSVPLELQRRNTWSGKLCTVAKREYLAAIVQLWNTWLVEHNCGRGTSCKESTPLVTIVHSVQSSRQRRKASILSSSLSLTSHHHLTPLNCNERTPGYNCAQLQQRKASIPSFSLSLFTDSRPPWFQWNWK